MAEKPEAPTPDDIICQTVKLSDFAKVKATIMYCQGVQEDFPENKNLQILVANILKILEG